MIHTHLNDVLWHLPTMFLGGALLFSWIGLRYDLNETFTRIFPKLSDPGTSHG